MDGRHRPAQVVPPRSQSATTRRLVTVAVRLLLTLGVLLLATLGAGTLVTGVYRGTEVEQVDAAAVEWLADQRTEMLDDLSGPAAELGNTGAVVGLGLFAAALTVALVRHWWPAVLLAVLLVGELVVFLTTAAVIDRPRPPVVHLDEVLPPTSSFPSGHTSAAICLYGGIAVLVLALTRAWWRWLAVGLAVIVIVTVALARLYRGAHYPTDVLGSLLFAVPWLVVTLRLIGPRADRRIRAGDAPNTQPRP